MNALTKAVQPYFFLGVALCFAGCGTIYVNEEDRYPGSLKTDSFAVERSVDGAYREVYRRLQDCVSIYGYRVRGQISRARDTAEISVDSGVGVDRLLYLADSLLLKAELERLGPALTRVTFITSDPDAEPFADGAKRWLISGGGPCRA